ncbi:MAG: DegT/DnrJ/EryC1/StrS family aminotransferase, partial [Proteobacteria bacterium]|nr:DegT/DnrJ/EryC1/StrS family aminotransferase [Pseudomonadota bacterium]
PGYTLRPLEMSGALGIEQLKKLPGLIQGRRANGAFFQEKLANHPKFIIQREVSESSWFGFSLVLRKNLDLNMTEIMRDLNAVGFECRLIVSGNFAKSEVVSYFDYEIHGRLTNADYIDRNGLFVGNHHFPISDAIEILATI